MSESPRTTLLGAHIGFHETQLSRSERELLVVFFDELGATVTEGKQRDAEQPVIEKVPQDARMDIPDNRVSFPSVTIVQPSLFDNKEAA